MGLALGVTLLLLLTLPLGAGGASASAPVGGAAPSPATTASPSPHVRALVTYPWWGGLQYQGTNTSGVGVLLGNLTIPATIFDNFGYNYTVSLGTADDACSYAQAGIEDSSGIWRFHATLSPFGAPVQEYYALHLAPGDTYQLVIDLTGGTLGAAVYNVSAGHFYPFSGVPDAQARLTDGASSLMLGPSTCGGRTVYAEANLTVRAAGTPTGSPSHDLFVQDEGIARSAQPTLVLSAPNLWTPYGHAAPSGFAPAQSWSTSDLLVLTSVHPAIVVSTTTAPPTDVDVGMAVGVGIAGTPHTLPIGANVNTYAYSQIEFASYVGTGVLSFATCHSQNGSNSNAGYPGADPGIPGEYGYSTNTTLTLSDIHLGYVLNPATNLSVDYRCFTGALGTPGNLTVWGLSYLEYVGNTPAFTYVDALSSGPREQLGQNALAWNVQVHPLPTITASTATPVVSVGQPATFSAWESGGSPTLSYAWFVDGTLQAGCTTLSCAVTWGAPGTHQVWAAVTDGYGARGVSGHLNETVDAALSASIAPYPAFTGTVGTPSALTASAVGGAGGNSYGFFVNGSATPLQSGPSGSWSYTPLYGGTYQLWVVVNDSAGTLAVSPHTNLTVALGVAAVVSPLVASAEVGAAPALFSVAMSGGAPPYTDLWIGPGLASSGSCVLECNLTSSTPGTYQTWVDVTDSAGRTVASPHANLTVVPPPTFTSWSGPVSVDLGANDTFHALFAGGIAPFTYAWDLNGAPLPYCALTTNCSITLHALGPAKLTVNLTDAVGVTNASTQLWITPVAPLALSLSPTPPAQTEVGLSVPLQAAVSSWGTGGLSFGFLTSAAPGAPMGFGPSGAFSWAPLLFGAYQVWVEANDSSGFRAVSAHANVTVATSLSATLSPAPTAVVAAGATLNATTNVAGGVGPYAMTWFADGTPEPSCPATYCSFRWTATGAHLIWTNVRDALGVDLATTHTNVSVGAGTTVSVTFLVGPLGSGSLTVNGGATPSGTTSPLYPGPYALVATASPGFTFAGWYVSNPTGLSLSSSTASSTTLLVSGGGSVMAEFWGVAHYSLGVVVSPAGTGNVSVNGTLVPTGGSTSLRAGVYALAAAPSGGQSFLGWVVAGTGTSVLANQASTFLELGGNSTITLETTGAGGQPTLYLVSFTTSPGGVGGSVELGATVYNSGAQLDVAAGTYTLVLSVPTGYTFQGWQVTGGVAVGSSTASTTTATVSGNGTLTATLVSSSQGGLLGLPTTTLELLGLLFLLLVVVIVAGALRHRSHARPAPPSADPTHPREGQGEGQDGPSEGDGP